LAHQSNLNAAEEERLADLEKLFRLPGEKDASEDTLSDYWDYCAEHDLPIDLDLKVAPPRKDWGK